MPLGRVLVLRISSSPKRFYVLDSVWSTRRRLGAASTQTLPARIPFRRLHLTMSRCGYRMVFHRGPRSPGPTTMEESTRFRATRQVWLVHRLSSTKMRAVRHVNSCGALDYSANFQKIFRWKLLTSELVASGGLTTPLLITTL